MPWPTSRLDTTLPLAQDALARRRVRARGRTAGEVGRREQEGEQHSLPPVLRRPGLDGELVEKAQEQVDEQLRPVHVALLEEPAHVQQG